MDGVGLGVAEDVFSTGILGIVETIEVGGAIGEGGGGCGSVLISFLGMMKEGIVKSWTSSWGGSGGGG